MYGAPKGNLIDFGRIATIYVREVGPGTFEARDPGGYFSAVNTSIEGAVKELKKRLGPGRLPRAGDVEEVVYISPVSL